MTKQYFIDISTQGRGLINVTDQIRNYVKESEISTGLCNLFLHHTSASIILCENADPLVTEDLERFMQRLVPDGDPIYKHVNEGEDDMPAHVRTVITQNSISIPITQGKLALGTWQGIYLWEHRLRSYKRKITVTCA